MVKAITNDKHAIEFYVDDEDAFLLRLKWYARIQSSGRLGAIVTHTPTRDGSRKTAYLHRIVLRQASGNGVLVDHADSNPANCCRDNLRLCSEAENSRNYRKPSHNTSGLKGAFWDSSHNKWKSQIRVNRKDIYLGRFNTAEEAHNAYCEAALKYHGEFARFD